MTKEQTKAALQAIVQACYYGSTRRSRLEWNLCQKLDIDLSETSEIIGIALDAHMLEEVSPAWIAATPTLT